MTDPVSLPRSSAWYRPGLADLVFLLVTLAVVRGAQHSLLDDPGLGWHLRNIDAMRVKGGALREDPFTDPRTRDESLVRWFSNQWLGELPYYLGWKWAGLEGIAVVNALVIAVIARALYASLIADGLAWPIALAWTALGMMGTSCSWNARPNTFSILFLFFTAQACVRLHDGRLTRTRAVWLVALFTIWANTHGGFVAGLITLAATCGIELALAIIAGEAQARSRFLRAGGLTIAVIGATLVNPYGVDLYRWVFHLLGDPFFMDLHQEWRSPDFHSAGAMRYELLILLFPLIVGLSDRRPSLVEIVLAVLWLHFALTGFRYVALWVIVVTPVLARASIHIRYLQDLGRRWRVNAQPGSLFHTRPSSGWLTSGLIAVALLGWSRQAEGTFAIHKQEIIASQSLDRFLDLLHEWSDRHGGQRPVIFNAYNWGGYLTWHGWPDVLNWIDDRNEVQGKERIKHYFAILETAPGWEQSLADVDFICIDPDTPLAHRLATDEKLWRRCFSDRHAVVFERR